jgi:hypothetical protein
MDLCPSIFMVEFNYRQAYQTYVDGPAFRGEAPGLYGVNLDPRFLEIHPEQRAELLK